MEAALLGTRKSKRRIGESQQDPRETVAIGPKLPVVASWLLYLLCFIYAGGLFGAWADFGALSSQMAHLGTVPHMAVLENASVAMLYDQQFRTEREQLERKRPTGVDWVKEHAEVHETVKKNVMRELGYSQAFAKPTEIPTSWARARGALPQKDRNKRR